MVSQKTTSTTIANLEAAVQSCSSLEIQFEATSKEKPVNIKIILWGAQWARNGHNRPGWVYVMDIGGVSHQLLDHRDVLNCQEALCAVEEFVDSPIELKTLSLKTTGSSVTRSTLKSLVESALCETLKMEIQTKKEKKAALKVSKAKEDAKIANFVELLKSGPDGVVQWSNTNRRALAAAGRFTKLDLSKLNLQGWKPSGTWDGGDFIQFADCDFSNSDFSGAELTGKFTNCQFRNTNVSGATFIGQLTDCDFTGATTDNTRFCSINMRNAKLVGVNLHKASFQQADLCGADLTDAILNGTNFAMSVFDNDTKFPRGFTPSKGFYWKGSGPDPGKVAAAMQSSVDNVEQFINAIKLIFDDGRTEKALNMLKKESFNLYSAVDELSITGLIRSQGSPDLVYSCRLSSDGSYSCCTQNLRPCGGLSGSLCKHIFVLLIGLVQSGDVQPAKTMEWIAKTSGKQPTLNKELMTATFLNFKRAEAGELDWRPTETIPEDYYSF